MDIVSFNENLCGGLYPVMVCVGQAYLLVQLGHVDIISFNDNLCGGVCPVTDCEG